MADVPQTISLVVVHDNEKVSRTNVDMEVPTGCHVEVLVDGTLEYVSDIAEEADDG